MQFELSQEHKAVKQQAREFAEKWILPTQKEDERKGILRKEVLREMGRLGFLGTVIPKEYGGSGQGILSTVLIVEEIGRISASYCMFPTQQTVGPGLCILKQGTQQQKEKYLRPLTAADIIGCFASTEPDAGSDVAAMKMTAVEKDGGYVLDGTKTWVTGGAEADVGVFFAYTDKQQGTKSGVSAFVVELKNNPGIAASNIKKLGLVCSVAGEIAFSDVWLSKDCLLGKKGDGYNILMEMLSNTRWCAAARALGVSTACLEDCISFVKEKRQSGQKLDNLQMLQSRIADMYVEHEAAKMLLYQGASNKDKGVGDALELSTAKYFCAESGVKAAEAAMEICGYYGVSVDLPARRYLRDSRCFPITEGTSNIQKVIISGQLLR